MEHIFQSLALLSFTLLRPQATLAQWVQTNGPFGGEIGCLAVSGANLLAGADGGGIFVSTNNGVSWSTRNSGFPINVGVNTLVVNGTNLFAGTNKGVYLSTDDGSSWTSINSGLTSQYVFALAILGTNLFAGTSGGGIFLSTNNGSSWTSLDLGPRKANPERIFFCRNSQRGRRHRPLCWNRSRSLSFCKQRDDMDGS